MGGYCITVFKQILPVCDKQTDNAIAGDGINMGARCDSNEEKGSELICRASLVLSVANPPRSRLSEPPLKICG